MVENFLINVNTKVHTDFTNDVLRKAAEILQRDILKKVTGQGPDNGITLKLNNDDDGKDESFIVTLLDELHVEIQANSVLGLMYGALSVSREVLHIDNFWFWLDQQIGKVDSITWNDFKKVRMPEFHVKYRGWFINDEVLINDWKYNESNEYVWEMIFETLLRCGGNIVIPGTDTNAHTHRGLADKFGLMIAHHHAEPLGAEMFSRVYPELKASYLLHPDLFKKLWQDSIDEQKDMHVLWNLGFRGQGDRPFWADDDHEYTQQDKADVINSVLRIQYDMVKRVDPEAMCSMNIYGELPALYNEGLLDIPEDVVQIWADNGYGKMLSRRQGIEDPRTEVLQNGDSKLKQGIYYHVAFHDLQASNFLTLLQIDPHAVAEEIQKVRQATLDDLVMVNTGSIKPHIFYLRLLAESWRSDFEVKSSLDYINQYVETYYGSYQKEIAQVYHNYFEATFNYRSFVDQKAGDEFYMYVLRKFVTTWLANRDKMPEMEWVTDSTSLEDQARDIVNLLVNNVKPLEKLNLEADEVLAKLPEEDAKRFYNDIWNSCSIHGHSIKALKETFDAYDKCKTNDFLGAFLMIDDAKKELEKVIAAWNNNPAEKWRDFYDNDCYTNISLSVQTLATLQNVLRMVGDGPDEDQWEREYLMQASDAKVMLLSNLHKAYTDDEFSRKIRAKGFK
ncbi:hypothetical protein LPAF129_10520 [Ligilactobacillus pabuli]|uniref:Glycosyl hydrolase family 115 n=1 Tax=Ligilactobacillus pabuli TaxID=2886039 RepID=A0ABQ5JH17_9LACO|nr:glycosyl hydrolase 115 family protein [Ligilactobacillus pabuli]GKS81366.1 hypothetical protein LPAF129_10520 [Ligilactobacillus pabuli]